MKWREMFKFSGGEIITAACIVGILAAVYVLVIMAWASQLSVNY